MSKEMQAQLLEQYINILQQHQTLEILPRELTQFISEMTQLKDDDVIELHDMLKCMHENSIQQRDYLQEQERKFIKENPYGMLYLQNFLMTKHNHTIPCKFPPVIRLPQMMWENIRKHYVNSNGEFFNYIGYLDSIVKYYNSALAIVLLYLEKLDEIKRQKQRENEEFMKRMEIPSLKIPSLKSLTYHSLRPEVREHLHNTLDLEPPSKEGVATLNCPSALKRPIPCATRKEYITQLRIFHPDKNSGCIEDSIKKFQILQNICKNSKGGKRKKMRTNKRQKKHKNNKTRRNKK
jgi:hypothetical protein